MVDEAVREHAVGEPRLAPGAGRAQWSVGSIEDDGIRYGLTTHALIASTIATAPTIVTIQSTAMRTRRGKPPGDAIERVVELVLARPRASAPTAAAVGHENGGAGGGGGRYSLGHPPLERRDCRPSSSGVSTGGPLPLVGVAHVTLLTCSRRHVVDPAVIAGEEDLGHRPSRGTRPAACSAGTRARRRAPRRSSRPRPSPRVSAPGSRRATASTTASAGISPPGEDVRADRDDVGAEVVEDPLVEALEARRQERERRLVGELLDELLVELPPLRARARRPGAPGSPPYTASSAAATTSTRSTIPGPPPYGSSSTWPALSGVVSR